MGPPSPPTNPQSAAQGKGAVRALLAGERPPAWCTVARQLKKHNIATVRKGAPLLSARARTGSGAARAGGADRTSMASCSSSSLLRASRVARRPIASENVFGSPSSRATMSYARATAAVGAGALRVGAAAGRGRGWRRGALVAVRLWALVGRESKPRGEKWGQKWGQKCGRTRKSWATCRPSSSSAIATACDSTLFTNAELGTCPAVANPHVICAQRGRVGGGGVGMRGKGSRGTSNLVEGTHQSELAGLEAGRDRRGARVKRGEEARRGAPAVAGLCELAQRPHQGDELRVTEAARRVLCARLQRVEERRPGAHAHLGERPEDVADARGREAVRERSGAQLEGTHEDRARRRAELVEAEQQHRDVALVELAGRGQRRRARLERREQPG